MSKRQLFGLALDVVLWVAVAFVLLGRDGPIRRYWGSWREQTRIRALVRAEWSQLASGLSHVGPSGGQITDDAPVVIEFADFECSYCRAAVDTLELFLRRHPEARVIFRHFPLTFIHSAAQGAARAAVCAEAEGRFREVYAWLFKHEEWKKQQDWLSVARAAGVRDINAFASCLGDPRTSDRVEREMALGRKLGVSGTPTFVSRRGIRSGVITVAELQKLAGL